MCWRGWFGVGCFFGFLVGFRNTGFLRLGWQLVVFRLRGCFVVGDCYGCMVVLVVVLVDFGLLVVFEASWVWVQFWCGEFLLI